PQSERPAEPDDPVPAQSRRAAAASSLGLPGATAPAEPGKPSSDAYAHTRATLPGQRERPVG
ncbi:AraC family transcriptional regulator, partial [Streptomyces sp. T-3]|nr:AraC family transcriptional regulator [Streptomyces sp. T-3]